MQGEADRGTFGSVGTAEATRIEADFTGTDCQLATFIGRVVLTKGNHNALRRGRYRSPATRVTRRSVLTRAAHGGSRLLVRRQNVLPRNLRNGCSVEVQVCRIRAKRNDNIFERHNPDAPPQRTERCRFAPRHSMLPQLRASSREQE